MDKEHKLLYSNVEEYLAIHKNKKLVRFLTCGNVDDGKSTLIGRLLYDSHLLFEDQINALKQDSIRGRVQGELDFSLLMDGLQSEREQGITIDVAYRYFSTTKRKFIIADTPGHEQYTRNMATGASTANLAVILVDARYGVQIQTKRHSFIAHLLGIKHFILAINKMDLINFDEQRFEEIKADYLEFAQELGIQDIHCIPISALTGENLTHKSKKMLWYDGQYLLECLETIDISDDVNRTDFRFPVQYINRAHQDFRGISGTIASGDIHVGDTIMVLPSKQKSTIKSIVTYNEPLDSAYAQMAITLVLDDEIDVSRGDCIVRENNIPAISSHFDAYVIWMNDNALHTNNVYYLKQGTKIVQGTIHSIYYKKDINTLAEHRCEVLHINEIGLVRFHASQELIFDAYSVNRQMGRFIIIDRLSNNTIGVGMIVNQSLALQTSDKQETRKIGYVERIFHAFIKRHFPHWGVKDLE